MYFAVIRIYPYPGREQAVIDVLDTLKGPTAASTDCLGCSVAVESGEDGVICYTEQWRTRDALDRHLCSQLYGRVLEALECSRQSPDVEFYEATAAGGLELIEQARITH